jgi:hypothetical protein
MTRGPKPISLRLTPYQQTLLEQSIRRSTSPQCEVTRAKVILVAAAGKINQSIANRLGLHTTRPPRVSPNLSWRLTRRPRR